MLTAAYHMLKNGVDYEDLSDNYFGQRDTPSSPNASKPSASKSRSLHSPPESTRDEFLPGTAQGCGQQSAPPLI